MIHQYGAQRFYRLSDGRRIGTIPIGTIAYIQDRVGRYNPPLRRNPWIVLAWLNRDVAYTNRYRRFAAGGHLALVRSLRDGRVQTISDRLLLQAEELEMT
ncbi:MAG TPA: hypothetical protein VGM05_11470 [Planctomycetaceae bacterium]|jgi:hypothetical protein